MSTTMEPTFEMKRVTPVEWVITDHRFPADDSRHSVACVYELEVDEVEVVWLREYPLALRYESPVAVLEDLNRLDSRRLARELRPIARMPRQRPIRDLATAG